MPRLYPTCLVLRRNGHHRDETQRSNRHVAVCGQREIPPAEERKRRPVSFFARTGEDVRHHSSRRAVVGDIGASGRAVVSARPLAVPVVQHLGGMGRQFRTRLRRSDNLRYTGGVLPKIDH